MLPAFQLFAVSLRREVCKEKRQRRGYHRPGEKIPSTGSTTSASMLLIDREISGQLKVTAATARTELGELLPSARKNNPTSSIKKIRR